MDIKRFIKKSKTFTAIWYIIRTKRNSGHLNKYNTNPVNGKKVLFYRSGGGYGDNPKAVAEYLHNYYPDIELVWACGNDSYFDSIPYYLKPVIFESEEYFKELATAGAWVCSTTLPHGTIKRKGQLYIQTWHGDKGFKKFANDAACDLESYGKRTKNRQFSEPEICDYFLTGAKWFIPKIRSAIGYDGEVIAHGLPRNDCLVNYNKADADIIRRKLGIRDDVKIIIYAPTFRDHEGTHEVVASDINLPKIIDAIEKKTKKEWICLLKAHAGKELKLDVDGEKSKFIDVTSYPDIADLLMISDAMITDYSSCAGDFALTDHFILLYQDDIESYITKDRTLYFDMKDTPYYVAHNLDEALKIIDNYDEEAIRQNCAAIREFYGACETGKACEEVVDLIIRNRERLEK